MPFSDLNEEQPPVAFIRKRIEECRKWHKVILATDGLVIDPYADAWTGVQPTNCPYKLDTRTLEQGPRNRGEARAGESIQMSLRTALMKVA